MKPSFKVLMSVAMSFGFVAGMLVRADAYAQEQPDVVAGAQVDAETFQKELARLRSEKEADAKRLEDMRREREEFVKEIRRVENLNTKYTQQMEELRVQMELQQKSVEERIRQMELAAKEEAQLNNEKKPEVAVSDPSEPMVDVERQAKEVFSKGGDLDPEDQKFKEELARAHYNMGNVYYERGEYRRAVVEYYQAVDLMPYDADARYNLAFVSGEYLGDQETALKHYQWYLYLSPDSKDRKKVEEKIVAAKLNLRGRTDSKVDMPEYTGHTNVGR